MLSKANSAVAVDYSKIKKDLKSLIDEYDKAINSISEQETALVKVKNVLNEITNKSNFEVLSEKLAEAKDNANILKGELTGLFTPLDVSTDVSLSKLETFTHSVGNLLSSFGMLTDIGTTTGTNLSALGGVLNTITSAFFKVALASTLIDADGASGITAVLGGLNSVLQSTTTLIESFSKSGLELETVAKFLAIVLGELCIALFLMAAIAKKLESEGLLGVSAVLYGLAEAIKPLASLFEGFENSNLSLLETAGLLGIVLVELVAFLFLISKAVKSTSIPSLLACAAALAGLGIALSGVASVFQTFGNSGLMVIGCITALAAILGLLIGFLVVLVAIAKVLASDPMTLLGLLAVVAAIAVVMNVLADTLPIIFAAIGDFLTTVSEIIISFLTIIGEIIVNIIEMLGVVLPPIIEALGSLFIMVLEGIAAVLETVGNIIINIIEVLGTTLPPIISSIGDLFGTVFQGIAKVIETVGDILINIIDILGNVLPPIIESVGSLFSNIFDGIANVIKSVGDVLVNILNTLEKLVSSVLDSILNFINELGPAINNFVDNAIDAVTKLINFIISGIEYLINTLIIGSINELIGTISGIAEFLHLPGLKGISEVRIKRFVPELAKGAVIPPRHEFLAVLGDQKHGTNIEAPLETIKQANREVMREFKGTNGDVVLKNLTVVTQFGNKEFKKMVLDSIRLSEKEIGKPLLLR